MRSKDYDVVRKVEIDGKKKKEVMANLRLGGQDFQLWTFGDAAT